MGIIEQAEAVIAQAQTQQSRLEENMAQFIAAYDNDDIDEMKRLYALADGDSALDQAIQDFTDEKIGPPPTEEEMAKARAAITRIKKMVASRIDEVALTRCPYCGQRHVASMIEGCPLKPE